MTNKPPPRVYWCNYMAMEDSLESARHVFPKSEWEDIRSFVEASKYDTLQAELEEAKTELNYLNRMLADERSGDCDKDKTIRLKNLQLANAQQQIADYEDALSKYPPNSHAYNVLKKWRKK